MPGLRIMATGILLAAAALWLTAGVAKGGDAGLVVTLKAYADKNNRPSLHAPGSSDSFRVGGRVVNDRTDRWSRVPGELNA